MGQIIDIADVIRRHQFPIEFKDRTALEQVLSQRDSALLLNSGSINFACRQPTDTQPMLFAQGMFAFPSDHPYLVGHFPGLPIVRTTDLAYMLGQTASLLLALLPDVKRSTDGEPTNHFRDWVGMFRELRVQSHDNVRPEETIIAQAWLDDEKPCHFAGPGLITGSIKGQSIIGRPDGQGGIRTIVVIDATEGFSFEASPRQRLHTPS